MFWLLCYCGSNGNYKQAAQAAVNGGDGPYVLQGFVRNGMNLIHTTGQTFTASMVTTFVIREQAAARGVNNITADAVPRAVVHRLYPLLYSMTQFYSRPHCNVILYS
jgi:hypothetical protein